MKGISFYQQKTWGRSQWPHMIVSESGAISGGVFFGKTEDQDDGTGFLHMDIDQVEELHRRLGEHLASRGRPTSSPHPPKWRDA